MYRRGNIWYACVSINGKPIRVSLGTNDPAVAEIADKELRRQVQLGTYRKARPGRTSMRSIRRASVKTVALGHAPAERGDWRWQLYRRAKQGAKQRGLDFELGWGDFIAICERAAGLCEVSGITLETSSDHTRHRSPYKPSIDRINSSLGYVAGNVRIVCVMVNAALNTWGDEALITVALSIASKWGDGRGSNPLPLESQSNALPNELPSPTTHIQHRIPDWVYTNAMVTAA